jgi:VIT1/CCC1 family predicted Fe2+/Mn2+ transporter
MIGIWSDYAQTYLLVFVIVTSTAFALPLFLKPLVWAKVMMWELPEETDLAVYFGRCLGAFICIVELVSLRAALTGEGIVFAFEVMLAVFSFMLVVHIYGALKKIQPITETLENILWLILLLLTLAFFPQA